MELNLPLFAYGGYCHTVSQQLPPLNGLLKEVPFKLPRRSDRLTQLSLLGLANMPSCMGLNKHANLVLASGDANLSSTIANSEQIFDSGTIPNPIGFINTVNNSTAFHISMALGIHGQSITVSRDHCSLEAGIQIASTMQFSSDSAILLGTADEIPPDLEQHRERLKISGETQLAEGSFWFLCSPSQPTDKAQATIQYCGPVADDKAAIQFFKQRGVTHHILGDFIQSSPLRDLALPGQRVALASQGYYLTQNAYYLQRWLDDARQGERLGMLNGTVGSRRLSVTLVEKH
ncbi:MAG: hypothetical protein ABW158_08385 [Candidatus Thiodiazotropha sp. 6PDIVS]